MFKWSDGSPWDYGNWDDGQPERSDEEQLFVGMSATGRWHDRHAADKTLIAMCQSKPEIYVKGNFNFNSGQYHTIFYLISTCIHHGLPRFFGF